MDSEKIPTLKPIPPQLIHCSVCTKSFLSTLQLTGYIYKTCDECRHKTRLQGMKHRKHYKQFISDLK